MGYPHRHCKLHFVLAAIGIAAVFVVIFAIFVFANFLFVVVLVDLVAYVVFIVWIFAIIFEVLVPFFFRAVSFHQESSMSVCFGMVTRDHSNVYSILSGIFVVLILDFMTMQAWIGWL